MTEPRNAVRAFDRIRRCTIHSRLLLLEVKDPGAAQPRSAPECPLEQPARKLRLTYRPTARFVGRTLHGQIGQSAEQRLPAVPRLTSALERYGTRTTASLRGEWRRRAWWNSFGVQPNRSTSEMFGALQRILSTLRLNVKQLRPLTSPANFAPESATIP